MDLVILLYFDKSVLIKANTFKLNSSLSLPVVLFFRFNVPSSQLLVNVTPILASDGNKYCTVVVVKSFRHKSTCSLNEVALATFRSYTIERALCSSNERIAAQSYHTSIKGKFTSSLASARTRATCFSCKSTRIVDVR